MVLVVLLTQKLILINNTGKIPSYQLSSGGRKLIAYQLAKGAGLINNGKANGASRANCSVPVLITLLLILVVIAAIQIAVVNYFGQLGPTIDNSGNTYGGPTFLHQWAMSPPPKINLHALLNRNVPSIESNLRRLKYQRNINAANRILSRENQQTLKKKTTRKPPNSPINDTDWISLNSIPDCPQVPSGLEGHIIANVNHSDAQGYTEESLERLNPELESGGKWSPSSCLARHRVALVIPYRDRKQHLLVLLGHLHPVLQKQMIDYQIFVVEQFGNRTFNKARIMNIAFITAVMNSTSSFDCFIFHDVDLVPEDDRNMYSCPEQPRHMSVAIDEMNYQIPYEELVGGVFAIRTDHFFLVNGYSNLYWGWGAEDDDMAYRIQHVGLRIIRPPSQIARYKMIRHTKRSAVDARIRYRLLWTGVRRHKIDGLNSLDSLNYKIVWTKSTRLYTHLMVDIGPPPPGF